MTQLIISNLAHLNTPTLIIIAFYHQFFRQTCHMDTSKKYNMCNFFKIFSNSDYYLSAEEKKHIEIYNINFLKYFIKFNSMTKIYIYINTVLIARLFV